MEHNGEAALPLPETDKLRAEQPLYEGDEVTGAVLKHILEMRKVPDLGTVDEIYGRTPTDIIFIKDPQTGEIISDTLYPAQVFTAAKINSIVAIARSQHAEHPREGAPKLKEVIENLKQ